MTTCKGKNYFGLLWAVPVAMGLIYLVFFTAPQNLLYIITFILLVTMLTYLLTRCFLPSKYTYLATFSVACFLTINYLVGFELMNNVLLLSFIIGLTLIVK